MAVKMRYIKEMAYDVANTVEHGEALYGGEMLAELLDDIDRLRSACIEFAEEYRKEVTE